MKPTKHFTSAGKQNSDLLVETGGDFEMAYYKLKEQMSVLSATINQLTMEKSRLLEEKEQFSSKYGRMNNKLEEAERDNSYHLLKEKHDKLLDEIKNLRVDNKTLQNKLLIMETEGGAN